MINIDNHGLSYSGNENVLLQNYIDISRNIARITKLNEFEINRLCNLLPALIKNENLEEKKRELENDKDIENSILKKHRIDAIEDLYNGLNIKRIKKDGSN